MADELNGVKLIPENISLFDESMAWDETSNLRTGVGYKDNVLLRHLDAKGSPFVASGIDMAVTRLPFDGLEFYLFVTADDNRYWHEVGVDKEDTAVAFSRLQKDFGNDWKLGSVLQYAYQNQIVDVSTIETGLSTARVQGHSLSLAPFARNDFGSKWWLQFELPVTRQFLKAPLDNYWQYGAKAILGHEYGNRSEFTMAYSVANLLYDRRFQFNAVGVEIAGAPLTLSQYKVELGWQHSWDAARRWRSASKAGFDYNEDSGSGYFSYFKYGLSEQLRYHAPDWEGSGKVGFSWYHFPVQPIGGTNLDAGILPKLSKTFLFVNMRAEKHLAKFVKMFAEFEHEESLSNDPSDRYRANTINGGFDWQF